jgi:hypothetical protein
VGLIKSKSRLTCGAHGSVTLATCHAPVGYCGRHGLSHAAIKPSLTGRPFPNASVLSELPHPAKLPSLPSKKKSELLPLSVLLLRQARVMPLRARRLSRAELATPYLSTDVATPTTSPRWPSLSPSSTHPAASPATSHPCFAGAMHHRRSSLSSWSTTVGSLLHPSPAISELLGVDTPRPGEAPPFLSLSENRCAKLAGVGHGARTVCSSEEKNPS